MRDHHIIRLKEVDSTNRYLMDRMTSEKLPDGLLVIAEYQTAGRGMDDNSWKAVPAST